MCPGLFSNCLVLAYAAFSLTHAFLDVIPSLSRNSCSVGFERVVGRENSSSLKRKQLSLPLAGDQPLTLAVIPTQEGSIGPSFNNEILSLNEP